MEMSKLEKVIRGLRDIDMFIAGRLEHEKAKNFLRTIDETIMLLKEQEAVVHPEPSCEMTYITNCCCDLCGVQLIREDNYCRCCGKRIEWEGR